MRDYYCCGFVRRLTNRWWPVTYYYNVSLFCSHVFGASFSKIGLAVVFLMFLLMYILRPPFYNVFRKDLSSFYLLFVWRRSRVRQGSKMILWTHGREVKSVNCLKVSKVFHYQQSVETICIWGRSTVHFSTGYGLQNHCIIIWSIDGPDFLSRRYWVKPSNFEV